MPITITIHESGQYCISKYEGKITDEELIPAYFAFYANNDVAVGLPELADLSLADYSRLSHIGLLGLAYWSDRLLQKRGISAKKTAIYLSAGRDTTNALIYEVWKKGSPEIVRIFEDKDEAVRWLMK